MVSQNGRHFSRDSFDRFGDDLCELVLSYLTDKDEYRFECVSKQWRRLIINKISTLTLIDKRSHFQKTNRLVITGDLINDLNRLTDSLKKCPNIKQIVFKQIEFKVSYIWLIEQHCPRLNSLVINQFNDSDDESIVDFNDKISNEAIDLFGHMFGPKMKSIILETHMSSKKTQKLLTYCPNVQRLKIAFRSGISAIVGENVKHLPKLVALNVSLDENAGEFSLFVDFRNKYSKQLEVLVIDFDIAKEQVHDLAKMNVFGSLAAFKELVKLDVYFTDGYQRNQILDVEKGLTQICRNCKKLTTIRLGSDGVLFEGNIWKGFAAFESLDSLAFEICITDSEQSIADIGIKKNIECLELSCYEMTEQWFENISQSVPNLKRFKLKTRRQLSDTLLQSLSGLKTLRELSLCRQYGPRNCFKISITDNGFIQLLDNCQLLRKIEFSSPTAMTRKSIESLIRYTKNTQKCIEFNGIICGPNEELNEIRLIAISGDIATKQITNYRCKCCIQSIDNNSSDEELDSSEEESDNSDEVSDSEMEFSEQSECEF